MLSWYCFRSCRTLCVTMCHGPASPSRQMWWSVQNRTRWRSTCANVEFKNRRPGTILMRFPSNDQWFPQILCSQVFKCSNRFMFLVVSIFSSMIDRRHEIPKETCPERHHLSGSAAPSHRQDRLCSGHAIVGDENLADADSTRFCHWNLRDILENDGKCGFVSPELPHSLNWCGKVHKTQTFDGLCHWVYHMILKKKKKNNFKKYDILAANVGSISRCFKFANFEGRPKDDLWKILGWSKPHLPNHSFSLPFFDIGR